MKSTSSKLLPAVLFLVATTLVACPTTDTGTPSTQGGNTADTTPPTLVSSTPANGAVNLSPTTTQQVVFNFSEPMSTLSTGPEVTCTEQTNKYDSECNNLNRTIKWGSDAKTLTLTFSGRLGSAIKLRFSFASNSNIDKAGNPVTAASVEFTLADVYAPYLDSSIPAKEAKNVPLNTTVSFTFNEAIDPSTFTVNCIGYYVEVKQCDVNLAAQLGPATWFAEGRTVVFKPITNLLANSAYTFIPLGKDLAGNALPDTRAAYDAATQVTFITAP